MSIPAIVPKKECTQCGESKVLSDFYRMKSAPDGHMYECKVCNNKRNKKSALKYHFGISINDYNALFEKQEGCCAICGTHQSELSEALHVDHDHDNGWVRGLLCKTCNIGLGHFKDNPELLDKAAEYLLDWK